MVTNLEMELAALYFLLTVISVTGVLADDEGESGRWDKQREYEGDEREGDDRYLTWNIPSPYNQRGGDEQDDDDGFPPVGNLPMGQPPYLRRNLGLESRSWLPNPYQQRGLPVQSERKFAENSEETRSQLRSHSDKSEEVDDEKSREAGSKLVRNPVPGSGRNAPPVVPINPVRWREQDGSVEERVSPPKGIDSSEDLEDTVYDESKESGHAKQNQDSEENSKADDRSIGNGASKENGGPRENGDTSESSDFDESDRSKENTDSNLGLGPDGNKNSKEDSSSKSEGEKETDTSDQMYDPSLTNPNDPIANLEKQSDDNSKGVVYNDDGKAQSFDIDNLDDTYSRGSNSSIKSAETENDSDNRSKDTDSLFDDRLSEEDREDGTVNVKDSDEDFSPEDEEDGWGSQERGINSHSSENSESKSDENGDDEYEDGTENLTNWGNEGENTDNEMTCSVDDIGRCLGKLARFHSRTIPTQLYSSVGELCRDVQRMRRCFDRMRGICRNDVMYRAEVLERSTLYICEQRREDFEEVYQCLTEASDRYTKCYITEKYSDEGSSVIKTRCRPVENFQDCVATVTSSQCGQRAGDLIRNYYGQSSLNPVINVETDTACPFIESLEQPALTEEAKTGLAVGLTLGGCVVLATAVVISAVVGARKRTQMQHYILGNP